jgi:hypothetical protein
LTTLQPVRVQVQEDVAALGVGAVHQGVDQQFAHHDFVEGGHVLAVQAIGQFVALAEVGHLQPDRLDQLHRALRVVVPHQLVDLLAVLVVLDELDDRCRGQLGAVMLAAKAEHAQVGEVLPCAS